MVRVILYIFCQSAILCGCLLSKIFPTYWLFTSGSSLAVLKSCLQDSQKPKKLISVVIPQYWVQECSQTRLYLLGESETVAFRNCILGITQPQKHAVLPTKEGLWAQSHLLMSTAKLLRNTVLFPESNTAFTYSEFSVTMHHSGKGVGVKMLILCLTWNMCSSLWVTWLYSLPFK